MSILLQYDKQGLKNEEGYVKVATIHYKPHLVNRPEVFDQRVEKLPEKPDGSYALYAHPETGELKWFKREKEQMTNDE